MENENTSPIDTSVKIEILEMKSMFIDMMKRVASLTMEVQTLKANKSVYDETP